VSTFEAASLIREELETALIDRSLNSLLKKKTKLLTDSAESTADGENGAKRGRQREISRLLGERPLQKSLLIQWGLAATR
jgi:hypothetical protein